MPRTILLVDKGKSTREILAFALRSAGYRVLEAPDGQAAWQRVSQSPPDLVLVEALLPRKTGFELCSDLKTSADYRRIPVILMSSLPRLSGGTDDVWRARTCADDFLSRPFELGSLLARIERLLAG